MGYGWVNFQGVWVDAKLVRHTPESEFSIDRFKKTPGIRALTYPGRIDFFRTGSSFATWIIVPSGFFLFLQQVPQPFLGFIGNSPFARY